MLAVHGLAMLAVIHIGIMQVDEFVVAIGDNHPMRRFRTGQSIAADQYQRLSTVLQQSWQVQRPAHHTLDIGGLQLQCELIVHQAHDVFFMRVAHTVEEQRAGHAELQAHPKSPSPGCQCQTLWAATTVTGRHEHGGRLAPDLQFFAAFQHTALLQSTHGHQQAGRAAGEIGGLRVIGHLDVS